MKRTLLDKLHEDWLKLAPADAVQEEAQGGPLLKEQLSALLRRCINAGAGIAEPAERSRLQRLAREIGDALFRVSHKYPDTVISPPGKATRAAVFGRSRLPVASERFFGREEQLASLDRAWDTVAPEKKINVITIVAWGGVGKSALVSRWLDQMAESNYRGAQRVFCWSFSGEEGGHAATVDDFFREAFHLFGVPEPAIAPFARGHNLADLVCKERALLILDNLEAIQSPGEGGRLTDADAGILLERLAGENAGLCLVTTRQKVIELEGYGSTVDRIELGDLSDAAGSELLRALGVKGSDEELLGAVNGSHGNALALNLLGAFLKDHYDGAVRPWRAIDPIGTDLQEGEHARRVVEASTSQLGEGPAIDVLRLLGLFPGKAEPAQVECLLREPPIQGLTDRILPFNRETWNSTVARLRRLELLTPANGDSKALDAHPLVRAYFTSQIRLKFRESCSEGHHRLFEHCMGDPTKPPKEKAEMEPLFEAMFHGCRAGEHETAYRKVLLPQILQWKEKEHSRFFSTNTLGLWSQTLEAIGLLFKDPWIAVRDEFSGHDAAFLFTSAGACLRALYRFREAVEATGRGLKLRLQAGEWSEAALAERMLNQMHIAAGQLREAQDFGRRSVEHALQGANTNDRAYARARCAESLHHGGKVKEALALFQEAFGEGDPLPDGFSEFEYCDLLMTLGRDNEAAARADAVIEREAGQKPRQPLWRGLGHLVLGRIDFSRGLGKPKSSSERTALLGNARDHLDRALEGLQAADEQQHLPLGYLARAMLNCAEYRPKEAEEDLAKVRRVAEPSGMLLHLTDYYLVSAVCGLEWGRLSVVAEHLEKARSLIEKTGYDRRGKELKELEDRTARKDGLGKR